VRENLIVVRCGRASRHAGWTAGDAPRNFDLLLARYEDAPGGDDLPALARTIPGQKWDGLARFLRDETVWTQYRYVWLPDDDIEADAATMSRFFEECRVQGAALAAPALAEGSEHSHLETLRNRSFRVRRTTFVEVMAPCFRRDVLERLLPTFSASATGYGWGLDDAWARQLGYEGLLVVDDAAVRHQRAVGTSKSAAQNAAAKAEMRVIRRRFDAGSIRKTRGGVDLEGRPLDERSEGFLEAYLEGYRWLRPTIPDVERRLRRHQAKDPTAWLAGAGRRAAGPWWRRLLPSRASSSPARA
jgi:hypothetical protein